MKTRVSSRGQIVLPAAIRLQDQIEIGDEFSVQRLDAGDYRLTRQSRSANAGLVQLLLSCPVKGWFRPLDRSESTDDLASDPTR